MYKKLTKIETHMNASGVNGIVVQFTYKTIAVASQANMIM